MIHQIDLPIGYYIDEDAYRHWCPRSEEFTGGDALMTAFEIGWQPTGMIFSQEFWHGGARRVRVFHIDLVRGDETRRMRVLCNPYVERLMSALDVQVVQMNQRKATELERW